MTQLDDAEKFAQAAAFVARADGLIITAGAGMGVDSGLPDFRGTEGFWRAYPALARGRIEFEEIANPQAFRDDPRLAWGFYGHRLALYRRTVPHRGFALLLAFAATMPHGAFVFTSNVDGQFQKAGFAEDRVCECHGSIHHLQCFEDCGAGVWPATFEPDVEEATCRLNGTLPRCPQCAALARPNVLMFGDWGWREERARAQNRRMNDWKRRVTRPVVIELGAGEAIPTVRRFSESQGAPLIRVNPRAPGIPSGLTGIPFAMGANEALEGIYRAWAARS